MYNRHPCVADDSYQLSYEHLRQLECAGHFRTSSEISPFKLASDKLQFPNGEKECFENEVQFAPLFSAGYRHYSCSVAKESGSSENEVVEIGKRPSSDNRYESANKRARQENQAQKPEFFDGIPFVSIPLEKGKLSGCDILIGIDTWHDLAVSEAEWIEAEYGVSPTDKIVEAGLDRPLDVYFQFTDLSHWRHVPVGSDHQADLPKWTPRNPDNSSFDANLATSSAAPSSVNHLKANSDKRLGTCIVLMPEPNSIFVEAHSFCSKIECDCTDEGSIRCTREHVTAAREKLSGEMALEKFIQLGFADMGEVVAQKWTEEEENLFHEVVSSNPASSGKDFWPVLCRAFPFRKFKELVSYYFNVFVLRKRAFQNRIDCSNADSDDDEWRESSDAEFAMSYGGEEEEDSAVESPLNGNIGFLKNEMAEKCEEFKSKSMDGNSTGRAEDRDVQDESCTSYEQGNHVEGDQR